MERKCRIHLTLKDLALQNLIKSTIRSLQNIGDTELIDVEKIKVNKRTRSYSCNDIDCENTSVNKNGSGKYILDTAVPGKRKHENEDDVHIRKRRKCLNEGTFKIISRRNHQETLINKSNDDIGVKYLYREPYENIRNYLNALPTALWNNYSQELSKSLISTIYIGILGTSTVRQGLKLVLNNKITKISTSNLKYFCTEVEGLIYNRIGSCRNLGVLDFTMVPENNAHIECLKQSFRNLLRLKYLSLVTEEKYSFHWAFNIISENCKILVELKIVYDCDFFNEGDSILCLKENKRLEALWLFNMGRNCETQHLKDILNCLTSLKILYHKELPNAILEYCEQREYKRLLLKRIDLCWFQKGLGYQLVYIPPDYMRVIAGVCPEINLLNLISPACLLEITEKLPNLRCLLIQQVSIQTCLQGIMVRNLGTKLTVIRLADVWDITYDLLSSIANGCPFLQVLSISSSVLQDMGSLITPSDRPAFPCLREAILVREELGDRSPLIKTADWKMGKFLTMFLLKGAKKLSKLHLQYDKFQLPDYDTPSENDLKYSLECCSKSLKSFELLFPPQMSHEFVRWLLNTCPILVNLSDIRTWPIDVHERLELMDKYKSILHIS
ncbi:unnamed protein product [Meganyctiphanes norvegica]|uniref:Uncharacterized protein n=1 Tax=Meganyctiphanes norvegica TaxID=48144 RepID=A0AAV2Q5Z0_MEGNR